MDKTISLWVPGIPATAGSKSGFYNKKLKRVIMAPANKNQKPWMAMVRLIAQDKYRDPPLTGPIHLFVDFLFLRPKSHFGTGRNSIILKRSTPKFHLIKPDLTKLTRSVEDALTGVVWRDDSQVNKQTAHKCYGNYTGVNILIMEGDL